MKLSTRLALAMLALVLFTATTVIAFGYRSSLAAVLAAIVLAFVLARSLSRPLAQMTAAVEAFGRRAPMPVPVSAGGEIGVLAQAFQRMADELTNSCATIQGYDERERFYVAAVESSPHAFIAATPDGTISAWNPGAERLFGYSAEEAIGQNLFFIVPDDKRDEAQSARDKIRRRERIVDLETVHIGKGGRRVNVLIDASPIFLRSGELTGLAFIARDVTAEKLAQEMFRLAVEACPSGMLMIDRGGTIVMVNSEIERLFGYERHELINQPVDILVPDRFRQQHAGHRNAFIHNPETRRMGANRDLFGRRKDGTEFPVEVGLNPIPICDGLLVLSVIVDISERKRMERLKDEFVSTVSHELRTPLTSIAGSLGLLTGGAAAG